MKRSQKVSLLTLNPHDFCVYPLCSICSRKSFDFDSYILFSVRLIPTVYELDWTYRQKKSDTDVMPWPTWVACVTNVR